MLFSRYLLSAAGIVTCVIGSGRTVGERMLRDKRLDLISFTGSSAIGEHVAEVVHRRFGRTILELGGNNATIVMGDANEDLALRASVFGAVGTAGQRCTSLRRLLIHEDVYASLVARMVKVGGARARRVFCVRACNFRGSVPYALASIQYPLSICFIYDRIRIYPFIHPHAHMFMRHMTKHMTTSSRMLHVTTYAYALITRTYTHAHTCARAGVRHHPHWRPPGREHAHGPIAHARGGEGVHGRPR